MKPRWKSVWIRPAHSGALRAGVERPRPGLLVAGRQERAQPEQVVGAADHAEQRAFAEPEALEHLGPLDRVDDRRRLGLELHAHADDFDVVAGGGELVAHPLLDLGDAVEIVLADVDDGEHRAIGQQEVRLQLLALLGLQAGAIERSTLRQRVVRGLQRLELGAERSCRASTGGCACFSRFSTVSRSARASSISTTRRCSIGSLGPGDVVVLERAQHEHDGVDLADVGEELVAETLTLRLRLRPVRRCRRPATAACTIDFDLLIAASWSTRSSGTLATPMLGSFVAKGYGAASAPPPVRALYSELLPALGRPTRPKRSIAKV